MIGENKISKFIFTLIKKTKKDEVEWEISNLISKMTEFEEALIDLVYQLTIDDKCFRIFKYKAKSYRDEYDWEWVDKIKFELVDKKGNSLYEFPYDYSFFDLYNAVREQTSGIGDIIDDIFKV
jgi:hypothetical protein